MLPQEINKTHNYNLSAMIDVITDNCFFPFSISREICLWSLKLYSDSK